MKLNEIKSGLKNLNLTVEVTELSPVREFSKFGRAGKVRNAIIKDDTGEMQLTLWDSQIDMVEVGDTINITDVYVKEWQGKMQLNLGRKGVIEKV